VFPNPVYAVSGQSQWRKPFLALQTSFLLACNSFSRSDPLFALQILLCESASPRKIRFLVPVQAVAASYAKFLQLLGLSSPVSTRALYNVRQDFRQVGGFLKGDV
jgi:hypothetical protein